MKAAMAALFTLFLLSSLHPVRAYAEEIRYITDVLFVPLRSGKGNQYRIIDKGLRSGTRLIVLEQDGEWSLVRTQDGVEGWIRSQYLQDSPTAAASLAAAEKSLAESNRRRLELERQVEALQGKTEKLSQALLASQEESRKLSEELVEIKQVSADAIDMHTRHQALMKQHQLVQTEIDVLKAEKTRLEEDSRHTWFLYGAGAVGFGVLIALVVPALRPRKRTSEWA